MTKPSYDLYKKIMYYCATHNLSIREFEAKCGIATGIISRLKLQTKKPHSKTYAKIAAGTHTSVDYWLPSEISECAFLH